MIHVSFSRLHRSNKFLLLSFIILCAYAALYVVFPELDDSIYSAFDQLRAHALDNGLMGMFIFSVAANATVFINIPYSTVAVLLAGLGLNPLLIALVAGVGAMIGEVVDYLIGFGSGRIISRGREKLFDDIRRLLEHKRYLAPVMIFIFGALPIPDYILLVPLGVIRYPFWKMVIAMTAGKIIQNFYFALLGKYSIGIVALDGASGNGFLLGMVSLILVLGAIYFVLRVDWERLVERWTKQVTTV